MENDLRAELRELNLQLNEFPKDQKIKQRIAEIEKELSMSKGPGRPVGTIKENSKQVRILESFLDEMNSHANKINALFPDSKKKIKARDILEKAVFEHLVYLASCDNEALKNYFREITGTE